MNTTSLSQVGDALHEIQERFARELDFTQEKNEPSQWPVWKVAAFAITAGAEERANLFPLLNKTQRKFYFHLTLWKKDEILLDQIENHLKFLQEIGSSHLLDEFLTSEDFMLYLKSKYSISSFDLEDPNYPDHDEYFLSPDNSFIFVFEIDHREVDLAFDKKLLENYYGKMGLNNAYEFILQMIGESFLSIQEEIYQRKISLDHELGWVNYFDALEVISLYKNEIELQQKASKVVKDISSIEFEKNHKLSPQDLSTQYFYKTLIYFWVAKGMLNLQSTQTEEEQKEQLLSSLSLVGIGIKLGKEYVEKLGNISIPFFQYQNYFELFKIGYSWIKLCEKEIHSIQILFRENKVDWNFLGQIFTEQLELFDEDLLAKSAKDIGLSFEYKALQSKYLWSKDFLKLSFEIGKQFRLLINEFKIRSELYENYDVTEITMEEFFINSLIRSSITTVSGDDTSKVLSFGIWKEDFDKFVTHYCLPLNNDQTTLRFDRDKISKIFENYLKQLNLQHNQAEWTQYFWKIFDYYLTDLEYAHLQDEDFAHLGGVVLFKIKKTIEDTPQ
ncbi:MAG: DUF6178 family protein [Bacteriovoracaceae bacterium]|nr:DUF6178 family protein [Bacteriovoracaceae bacterium]